MGHTEITPFGGFNTFINVLMGTGPILLPPAIADAGIILGGLWLLFMYFFSSAGAEFVVEALSITNAMSNNDNSNKLLKLVNNYSVSSDDSQNQIDDPREIFALKNTLEYGKMGYIIWGKKGQFFNAINIIVYVYGLMITKGIITGNSLSNVFYDVPILNEYYFWVLLFFLTSGALSFKNISSITIVQTIVAMIRYLVIVLMMGGAMFMILDKQRYSIKMWNFNSFPNLFSSSIFAFLMHHSIPGMLRPINPSSSIRNILNYGFSFAGVIFFLLPLTGMMAFQGLSQYCYYNTVFDETPIKFIYYIVSFYIFLNIAALPVITITQRTNMMQLCCPDLMPQNNSQVTKETVAFTLIIILPCIVLSLLLQKNISFVVGITGGVCGVIIMMIIPSLMVLSSRKLAPSNPQLNPFRSKYYHSFFAIFVISCGCIFMPYNLYLQIQQLIESINKTSTPCLYSVIDIIPNITIT